MGKITSMTIAEAKRQYTPAQVKAMIAKAKVSKDDNPYTIETDLTADEIAMIDEGMAEYRKDPSSFVPLDSIQ